ncbi:MAG: anthranilate phosphoribosyltransferase [bacterium]
MIKEAIAKVVESKDLSETEAIGVMNEIMEGAATPAQIASFITALRIKGETVEEISGCARVMRQKATPIVVGDNLANLDGDKISLDREIILDTCGTGGDKTNSFNISTSTAFVVAAAGVKVAKHGNRSVSSKCGSADVLQALGVNIETSPSKVEVCIEEIGIGFLYAPLLHTAMKHAIGPRKEIGIRTIFNILGPLTNPARANAQVLGVYDPKLTECLAQVLKKLGTKRAMVVHGEGGLDELSTLGATKISELKDGKIETYKVTPEDVGLPRASLQDIKGGDAQENANIILSILKGEKGARRDIVLLNASAAITVAGISCDLKAGISIAEEAIDSGKALEKLALLITNLN